MLAVAIGLVSFDRYSRVAPAVSTPKQEQENVSESAAMVLR